jgi:hypothetical protein
MKKELEETVIRLRKFNQWRRGAELTEFNTLDYSPRQIGLDLDYVLDYCEGRYENRITKQINK